jgi:hypothetical protein
MIYFTAFSKWEFQFGELQSIAKYPPKSHSDVKTIELFVPNWRAVQKYKNSPKSKADWEDYVEAYRKTCRSRWNAIKHWLDNLDPETDVTLCCWERSPVRCHRSLVAKIVETYRPDCYGGLDVRNGNRQIYTVQRVQYRVELVERGRSEGWSFRVRAPGSFPYDFGVGAGDRTLSAPHPTPEKAWLAAEQFLKN